jgi:hypothetical protein
VPAQACNSFALLLPLPLLFAANMIRAAICSQQQIVQLCSV